MKFPVQGFFNEVEAKKLRDSDLRTDIPTDKLNCGDS